MTNFTIMLLSWYTRGIPETLKFPETTQSSQDCKKNQWALPPLVFCSCTFCFFGEWPSTGSCTGTHPIFSHSWPKDWVQLNDIIHHLGINLHIHQFSFHGSLHKHPFMSTNDNLPWFFTHYSQCYEHLMDCYSWWRLVRVHFYILVASICNQSCLQQVPSTRYFTTAHILDFNIFVPALIAAFFMYCSSFSPSKSICSSIFITFFWCFCFPFILWHFHHLYVS